MPWNRDSQMMRQPFFSKGERAALFHPTSVTTAIAPDDLYPGRKKLSLGFDLPKGAYATLVVKRCTQIGDPDDLPIEDENDPDLV